MPIHVVGERGHQRGVVAAHKHNARRALHANEAQMKPNTLQDLPRKPLADPGHAQQDKEDALDKHGRQGDLVLDALGPVEADDGVGEVGVEAHAGSEAAGEVGKEDHE
ncbi:hypothetical protein CPC16_005670 [Podila verticillata]|nr:hypothetical protein CPC16_005670 [Podila verticillata]